MSGLTKIGPNFVGLDNYQQLFSQGDIWIYAKNTMIMWILCFVPQILLSLLLGAWFSDVRLRLKGSRFFKTVIYLPNLIMASAFSMLFFTLFSDGGPINSLLMQMGILSEPYKFLSHAGSARSLVGFMNFLMWFGNTTILLLAGMLGIDTSLYEAAEVDGATSTNADNAIETIKEAIQKVSTQRSALGAVQNRLEHTINNLDNVVENTTSAESAIRDTDMATEMVKYSNNNILAQAGQAMLAQSNQSNQGVLSLLQ